MDRYAVLRGRTDKLLGEYGSLLADLVSAPAQQEQSAPWSPKEGHTTDTSLDSLMEAFHSVKRCHESHTLSVAVLALTKSGKSTFLNALLGEECMPSGTVPETARICRIVHDPELHEPTMVDGNVTLQGSTAVRQRLHDLNSAARGRRQGGGDQDILSIATSFPALEKVQSMSTTLHLLDTPGPNEAGEEGLKYQVEQLLDGIGVLVYLLDCKKLKTQEEKQLFQRLKEINPQLLKRLSHRLFFLVNKKDVLDDMSEEEVRQYVAELVTGQMEDQQFQLKPQQVMLISAKTALYNRLVMTEKASQEQCKVFAKMAFGQAGYQAATKASMLQTASDMFKESGFQSVEQHLLHFLYDHAGRMQLMGTLDDMTRNATQVTNTVATCEASMQRGVEEMSLKMAEMSAQMKHASQRFEDVRLYTNKVQQEVTDEIRTRLMILQKHLLRQIEAVLSEEETPDLSHSWERLRGYVQKALHSPSSVPKNSQHMEVDIQNRLADVYGSINDQVGQEVRSFWHDLESATNQRQQELFAVLNQKLQDLSREFDSVVTQRLDLQLEATNVRLSPPSFQEYHRSLGQLLQSGVARREVKNGSVNRIDYKPLCKLGKYCYAQPVLCMAYKRRQTEVGLSAEKVKQFFKDHVEEMVKASGAAVGRHVGEYLAQQVEGARSALGAYCSSYHSVMGAALAESSESEGNRLAALATARERLQAFTQLKAAIEALAAEVEGEGAREGAVRVWAREEALAGAAVTVLEPWSQQAVAMEGGKKEGASEGVVADAKESAPEGEAGDVDGVSGRAEGEGGGGLGQSSGPSHSGSIQNADTSCLRVV